MSQENVEALRRAFDAFSRGDLDAAVADAAPDVEYVTAGVIPGQARVTRSAEELKEAIRWLSDAFADSRLVAEEILDAGEKVLGGFTLSGRGKASGVETSMTLWQVWTFKEGKFIHGQGFTNREQALEAAGLSE
jgi:ketosteroid isomerase-like protein